MALGAVAALREAGLAGKVFVTGTDGSSDVVKLIETGEMLSTMSGLNEYQGAIAAALAYGVRVGDIKLADLSEAQRDFFVQQILITKETRPSSWPASLIRPTTPMRRSRPTSGPNLLGRSRLVSTKAICA